jgi:hypothetical protein
MAQDAVTLILCSDWIKREMRSHKWNVLTRYPVAVSFRYVVLMAMRKGHCYDMNARILLLAEKILACRLDTLSDTSENDDFLNIVSFGRLERYSEAIVKIWLSLLPKVRRRIVEAVRHCPLPHADIEQIGE